MARPVVHIAGAGLAGLAAAVKLAGRGSVFDIVIYDAARQAGGRCRSYFDSSLGMVIDNGNHLLLSGNLAARRYLDAIGASDALSAPARAEFSFLDLETNERWRVRPNDGPLPWWIFFRNRRAPHTNWRDYLTLARLLVPGADRPIKQAMPCQGGLYERLWRPFLLAALNTEPSEGSTRLAGAVVRETLAKGGRACRPMFAARGLSAAFVEPALLYLKMRGADIRLDHRLRAVSFSAGRASGLDFGDATATLGPADHLILAVPPQIAQDLLPGTGAPQTSRAIVNAHFKIAPPADFPAILGVVNGLTEWIFSFPDRISVTISGADRLLEAPREKLAADIWSEIQRATGLGAALPPWQIIKEKRATFAATPEENARRPGAKTAYNNLALAGDWTATGLPATIEGAIRSGNCAAELIINRA
ncbi:hydroxysqualene dehydroxylase HpnE [Methylocapsa palsarum]|uniref:Squalene-associated FAD-dependent desaturase n=1 Tax=Methylocapsa palsarum TaxID=1612308 RepID=A0A1I3VTJ9_9HYPH|nr:hydroxysqualene dehydroxylase HpnE [Methylocapsa palsarum]SFJ97607.1 squalene-associated FAD-dependent desaturase [Methylocapsa palsarum]